MPTAKSYENCEIVSDVFEHEGKKWVNIKKLCDRCSGSGHYSYNQLDGTMCYGCRGKGYNIQSVRWYTESQRAAMDKAAEKRAEKRAAIQAEKAAARINSRHAFGFDEAGYITIYKGDSNVLKTWLYDHRNEETGYLAARFNMIFKWYTPSKMEVPTDLPEGITPIRLNWDDVKINDIEMKPNEEVTKYVDSLLEDPSTSEFQGEVGTWLELPLTVKKRIDLDGQYGTSHMHIMEDANKNVYVWTTGSKSLNPDETYNMKVKVKEHKEYKNVKQTIVWYCKIK